MERPSFASGVGAWVVAAGLGLVFAAPAPARAQSSDEAASAITRFETLTMLPLSQASAGTLSVSHDPFTGEVTLRSTAPFGDAFLSEVAELPDHSAEVAGAVIVSRDVVVLRLQAVASGFELVRVEGRPFYLVVGRLRRIASLRRHFLGDDCALALPKLSDPAIIELADEYCAGRLGPEPPTLPPASQLNAIDRAIGDHLTDEVELDAELTSIAGYERLLHQTTAPDVWQYAWVGMTLVHALRDELPSALERLEGSLRQLRDDQTELRQVLESVGSRLFRRLLYGALQRGDAREIVGYYRRFDQWLSADAPTELLLQLATAFRGCGEASRAAELYLQIMRNEPSTMPVTLIELAATYREAGDEYRAAATEAYARERYEP